MMTPIITGSDEDNSIMTDNTLNSFQNSHSYSSSNNNNNSSSSYNNNNNNNNNNNSNDSNNVNSNKKKSSSWYNIFNSGNRESSFGSGGSSSSSPPSNSNGGLFSLFTSCCNCNNNNIINNDKIRKLLDSYSTLNDAPRELWFVYCLKFLESFSYFSFAQIFTIFLSDEFHFTDQQAGLSYGIWGALFTLYGLVGGMIIDNLGVRRALILGSFLSTCARIMIAFTRSHHMLYFLIFVLQPLGACMGVPVMATGIRRYTNLNNRGFAFGLFYTTMNISILFAGPVIDFFTMKFPHTKEDSNFILFGTYMTANRWIAFAGGMTSLLELMISSTCIREIKVEELPDTSFIELSDFSESGHSHSNSNGNNNSNGNSCNKTNNRKKTKNLTQTFVPKTGSPYQIMKEMVCELKFWRFISLVLILANLRVIFRHMDATFPKYLIREFGDNVPKGSIISINPFMIICLVPILSGLTQHVKHYDMIHFGSYISGISAFFLAFSTSIWSSICFVVTLSIGEAIWSPRFYDYTVTVSPEGREGTFMALSSAPLFAVKLPVGIMSGWLLETFCPKEGERDSQAMWLIVASMCMVSPFMLTFLERYVRDPDVDAAINDARVKLGSLEMIEEINNGGGMMNNNEKMKVQKIQNNSNGNSNGNSNSSKQKNSKIKKSKNHKRTSSKDYIQLATETPPRNNKSRNGSTQLDISISDTTLTESDSSNENISDRGNIV